MATNSDHNEQKLKGSQGNSGFSSLENQEADMSRYQNTAQHP